MAIMINCGIDWTLDLAWEDASKVKALPWKRGLYRKTENEGQALFQYLKTDAKFFKEEVFGGKNAKTDHGFIYVGDAWLNHLDWSYISDWYKDAYGQRPHFYKEFFATMCGLPTEGDTALFFCKSMDSYLYESKWNREHF